MSFNVIAFLKLLKYGTKDMAENHCFITSIVLIEMLSLSHQLKHRIKNKCSYLSLQGLIFGRDTNRQWRGSAEQWRTSMVWTTQGEWQICGSPVANKTFKPMLVGFYVESVVKVTVQPCPWLHQRIHMRKNTPDTTWYPAWLVGIPTGKISWFLHQLQM